METEKLPENLGREIKVRCDQCRQEFLLVKHVQERDLESPHDNIVQAKLICPYCDHTRHLYFLTPQTARIRINLRIAVDNYQRNRTRQNQQLVLMARKAHQQAYDADQENFKFLLEEEYASAQP